MLSLNNPRDCEIEFVEASDKLFESWEHYKDGASYVQEETREKKLKERWHKVVEARKCALEAASNLVMSFEHRSLEE